MSTGSAMGGGSSAGVRENRGAGATWVVPCAVTTVWRSAVYGWRGTSCQESTGVVQASRPAKTAAHSSLVLVAKTSSKRLARTG